MEPVGHTGDSGGGDVKFTGDSVVGALFKIESCGDLEAFGKFADFGESQKIAQEPSGFVWVFKF